MPLTLELNGFGPDPFGGTRAGFTATGEINRRDFNVSFTAPMQNGGVVVADKISLHLEIEAVLEADRLSPAPAPFHRKPRKSGSSERDRPGPAAPDAAGLTRRCASGRGPGGQQPGLTLRGQADAVRDGRGGCGLGGVDLVDGLAEWAGGQARRRWRRRGRPR